MTIIDNSITCQSTGTIVRRLHRDGAFGYYWTYNRQTEEKRTYWHATGDDHTPPNHDEVDVYFGVHPTREIPTTTKNGKPVRPEFVRGRVDLIDQINCLFAEFDAKDFAGGKDAALRHVQALPDKPTILVDSGGGYHAYWMLKSGLYIEMEEQLQDAADLQRAWVAEVGGDEGSKDLARVLRVPGTVNHKYPQKPPVGIVWDNGEEYPVETLMNHVVDILDEIETNRKKRDESPYTGVNAQEDDVIEALGHVPTTGSYDDWLTVLMGIHSAFPGENGIAIAESWSPGYDGEVAAKWDSFSRDGNEAGAVTIATVFHLAQQNGWSQGARYTMADVVEAINRGESARAKNGAQPVDDLFGTFDLFAYDVSDGGIADIWIDTRGDDHMYVRLMNQWHRWSGKHWEKLDEYAVRSEIARLMHLIGKVASAMAIDYRKRLAEAEAEGSDDTAMLEAMVKKATAWQQAAKRTKNRVSSVYDLAVAESYVMPDSVDVAPILALQNGTLDLGTLEFRPHSKDDLSTHLMGYSYDPTATAPRWQRFVTEVIVHPKDSDDDPWLTDSDAVLAMQEAIGYALTADTRYEKMFWMSGSGGNGKSVLVHVVKHLLGELAVSIDFGGVGEQGNYGGAAIPGRRVLFSTEIARTKSFAGEFMKKVVSGDPLRVRQIYKEEMEFTPIAKVFWAMNENPRITDTSDSIYRRLMLFEFRRTFGDEAKVKSTPGVDLSNTHLRDELVAELPGILNWAIDGLRRLRTNGGFTPADSVMSAVKELQFQNNTVANFVDEMATVVDAYEAKASDVYTIYSSWCKTFGYTPKNNANFGKDLTSIASVKKKRTRDGYFYNLSMNITMLNNNGGPPW